MNNMNSGTTITSAAVLFADLRGYTAIAERLPAQHVMILLEEFYGVLATSIQTHCGQIYHIAGDGIMAGFGLKGAAAKHTINEGAVHALAAGREMVRNFAPVASRWRTELSIQTGIGVGIHEGEVASGFLGPSGQQTTTLIGDTVNVAARLCNRARAGEVLFSSAIAVKIEAKSTVDAMAFLQLPRFAPRGRRNSLDIWCVPALERVA